MSEEHARRNTTSVDAKTARALNDRSVSPPENEDCDDRREEEEEEAVAGVWVDYSAAGDSKKQVLR